MRILHPTFELQLLLRSRLPFIVEVFSCEGELIVEVVDTFREEFVAFAKAVEFILCLPVERGRLDGIRGSILGWWGIHGFNAGFPASKVVVLQG
ncbi:hypothetical protein [Haloarchaeobius sp. DYHT-AS-18]|uniref:hypothetical protein n=1 Tax=Haloarchaeobius sp. DYHT-AS-18 TaxID=3446117 RepID=UPI003EBA68E6